MIRHPPSREERSGCQACYQGCAQWRCVCVLGARVVCWARLLWVALARCRRLAGAVGAPQYCTGKSRPWLWKSA